MRMWIAPVLCAILLMATCTRAHAYQADRQPVFGTYSKAYQDRQQAKRWRALCKGAGRYQAMSEAYEAGKPDPCNAAREWVR